MAAFSFFVLPPEVRNKIYEYYFTGGPAANHFINQTFGHDESPYYLHVYDNELGRNYYTNFPLNILHACRQLRKEAKSYAPASCILWLDIARPLPKVDPDFDEVVRSLPTWLINGMKQLRVSIETSLQEPLNLSSFYQLQKVMISVTPSLMTTNLQNLMVWQHRFVTEAALCQILRTNLHNSNINLWLGPVYQFGTVLPWMNRIPYLPGPPNMTDVFMCSDIMLRFKSYLTGSQFDAGLFRFWFQLCEDEGNGTDVDQVWLLHSLASCYKEPPERDPALHNLILDQYFPYFKGQIRQIPARRTNLTDIGD